jgi:hypothetical protein
MAITRYTGSMVARSRRRGRFAQLEAAEVLCVPSMSDIMQLTFLETRTAPTVVPTSDISALAGLKCCSPGGTEVSRDPPVIAARFDARLADHQRKLAIAGQRYWRSYAAVKARRSGCLHRDRSMIVEQAAHTTEATRDGSG